ncbi:50S ribosomal protein L34e [Candidatus Woesearchaeota archaeon]|nr:50S ribosomal protein L34e [Candidatus Woesearchaeota archaeon]
MAATIFKQSRSFRVVKVKAPGNRIVVHWRKRNPKGAHCGKCGTLLNGMPRLRPVELNKLSKSQKRPERPYGGMLCSSCTRQVFIEKARAK